MEGASIIGYNVKEYRISKDPCIINLGFPIWELIIWNMEYEIYMIHIVTVQYETDMVFFLY